MATVICKAGNDISKDISHLEPKAEIPKRKNVKAHGVADGVQ